MKILLSILREMADIPADPEVVAVALTDLGLAVEEMDVVGTPVPGVVTARIIRMEKHPDAAKVTRCFVDAGDVVQQTCSPEMLCHLQLLEQKCRMAWILHEGESLALIQKACCVLK